MIDQEELRERVRATVAGLIADGREAGVQVCAYLDGEVLLDETAGLADRATVRALTAGTPITGDDWATGFSAPRGLGYQLQEDFFGASGNGGSITYAFPAIGLTVAATKNLLSAGQDDPMEDLRSLIRAAAGSR